MRFLALMTVAALLCSCQKTAEDSDPSLEDARNLAQEILITDGHVDLPYRMRILNFRITREYLDFEQMASSGNFSYEKAKEGGLDAPFMSIYIPAEYQEIPGRSKQEADSLINLVENMAEKYPEKFMLAKTPQDVKAAYAQGKISLPMGMENGSGIEDDLSNVQYFFDRGIRYVTLTHSKDNLICDSSYDTTGTWNGLSEFGEQVVREMNRIGIMVDISHVSDSAFYDVMNLTKAPVIASHSSARAFTPGFERNMNDDMIRLLGKNGGVIQINFGSTFIDSTSRNIYVEAGKAYRAHLKENNLEDGDSTRQVFLADFIKDKPEYYSHVRTVADHIDHVVEITGIDHVALGSDFDGVSALPVKLKDVSQYPELILELLKRGYTEDQISKICHENVFRVWEEVIRVAESS